MNILLEIGLLLAIGYWAGWLFDRFKLPRILGYITTGIFFSPNTINFLEPDITSKTSPILEICLAFIAFEVGGALKWSKVKRHEKEIISITLLASIIPYLLIAGAVIALGALFPQFISMELSNLLSLAVLLGALASPTAPAATLAVIHQYKARGKVTDTILGVAALDDVLGILLFSLSLAVIFLFNGSETGGNPLLHALYEIFVAISLGVVFGLIIGPVSRFLRISGEGQWVVLIFSLIILCAGLAIALNSDVLLTAMTMGIVVVNKCPEQKIIFRILSRYTEEFIFLFFFILSGLHLDISTLPQASVLIALFVVMRTAGKYTGTSLGSKLVHADRNIQKYTAGGLLPQAGIVIGLVLSIQQYESVNWISELLLTTIMGTTVIYELIGPVMAKYSLSKAGEIKSEKHPDRDH